MAISLLVALTAAAPFAIGEPDACLTADIDGDGLVAISDLLAVLGEWGPCSDSTCPADINRNGAVEIDDLLLVLSVFGSQPEPPWFDVEHVVPPESLIGSPFPKASALSLDLDGDGDQDIIAPSVDVLHAFLNDGCGRFELGASFPVEWIHYLDALHLVDVDGDGDRDLVTSASLDDRITVMIREGLEIVSVHDVAIDGGPRGIASADFDGDGDQDLAVAAFDDNVVKFLLNDGSGGFTFDSEKNGGGGPYSVALDDVDLDGDVDVAVANDSNMLVWFNNGSGVFSGADVYNSGGTLVIADLDVDGWPDLVVSPPYQPQELDLVVRYGLGDGLFGDEVTYPVAGRGVTVADVDFDGDPDLVLPSRRGVPDDHTTGPVVAVNTGDREFEIIRHRGLGSETRQQPIVDDLDGDGVCDLVLRTYRGSLQTILSANVDPLVPAASLRGIVHEAQDIAAVDIDGDSDLDVLAVSDDQPNHEGDVWLSIFLNDGSGALASATEFTVPEILGSFGNCQVETGDLDNDGDDDILFADRSVGVLLNSDGAFDLHQIIPFPGIEGPESMVAADFNGDGFVDFALADHASIWLFVNDGRSAGFELHATLPVTNGHSIKIIAADIQDDGEIDIVYIKTNGSLGVWTSPALSPPTVVVASTGFSWPTVAAGDLVGDSQREIVVTSEGGTRIWRWTDGALEPMNDELLPDQSVVIADLNADGQMDIVLGSTFGAIKVYAGVAGGTVAPVARFYNVSAAHLTEARDMTGDGVLDLLMFSENGGAGWKCADSCGPR